MSDFDNVITNFRYLPDTWDGAMNIQDSSGGLRRFDVGPLVLTYSTIGTPRPETDPGDNASNMS